MDKLFPTQEIGSLAKPRWRVKCLKDEPLSKSEIAEARNWGRKLRIKDLSILDKMSDEKDSAAKRRKILELSARFAIRFFEVAGLDIFFDGEQWRSEMYEHVAKNAAGFEFLGFVKSFDYRYFRKAACVKKPEHTNSYYSDEFVFTRKNTEKTLKIPFTGPYTLVDWTFNEYYEERIGEEATNLKHRKAEARREFLLDIVKDVVRPEVESLVKSGASWIQIDEPAVTTNPTDDEMKLFVESFNGVVEGFNCIFSLHNCYSDYEVLARYACELKNCSQLALEFANRDSRAKGTRDTRTGYKDILLFEDHGFRGNYGLGVIDVHTDFVEPPELVRDRILHVAGKIDDPSRIYVSTDCGLRTRSLETSFRKLRNLVLGSELARRAMG